MVVHPEEAPVRKLMYELFLEEKRSKTVARLLNDRGYRTRTGKSFSGTTVTRLIADPTAKGKRRSFFTTNEGTRWKTKPEEAWIWTEVEAIVSEELWDACNQLLEARKLGKRPARRTVHLFSGFVFCACNDKAMYVPSNSPKYTCRTCRRKIRLDELERVFVAKLRSFFLSTDDVSAWLAATDERLVEQEALVATLEAERMRITAEMDKTYALYLADQIGVDAFGLRHRPLEERLAQIGEELPRLQAQVDYLKVQSLSSAQVLSDAEQVYDRWEELPHGERRYVVESMVNRIVVADGKIGIVLLGEAHSTPDPSPETVATGAHYPMIPVSPEDEAQVARLKYVLGNSVKEGLVARPQDWPGVNSAQALIDGQPLEGIWIDRTKQDAARRRKNADARDQKFSEAETLHFSPLPCWAHLPAKVVRRRVAQLVKEIEDEGLGEDAIGTENLRSGDPHYRSPKIKKSPKPRFHAATRRVLKEMYDAYAWVVQAYREASERLKEGDLHAPFPEGTFPPGQPFVAYAG